MSRKLKKIPLVWFLISVMSSLRTGCIVFWKWDGTDWQLIRKKVSIFTNRFEMDCSWLIKRHSSIFEKMYTPKAGDFVLDVGGGLGLELPRWSKLVGTQGRILVIEPDEEAFRRYSKTVNLLPHSNVTILKVAVGDFSGPASLLKVSGNSHKNYISTNESKIHEETRTQSVQVLTLDKIFELRQIHVVDFCKINVEGFEVKVLRGAKLNLKRIKNLVVSCHDFLGKDFETYLQTQTLLEENDFKIESDFYSSNPVERFYIYARNTFTIS